MLSVELKEKSFGSFELKLEGSASGFCTGSACFYLLPSTCYFIILAHPRWGIITPSEVLCPNFSGSIYFLLIAR
ncbi:hypothetical protein DBT_0887 [Dissulfuribacter thermophilus]|uniref:Uncharacterized protein n=1 Tax=Dissulfuribacter thermophilus TaxID=1156395 RepID=A0A1B9F6J8_9BACT|nr:hypothetical protein DBT_0887 [Dissulfuribacter thermophilus]